MPKITFLGAGSTIFAKNVLGDSMLTPSLADSVIALYDIDPQRLEESHLMLTALNNNLGNKARIETYCGVENRRAALRGANLRDAKGCYLSCPTEGSFIGWKKASGHIVKLRIPEDARRSSATGHKCRCDKAYVMEIQNMDGTKATEDTVRSDHDKNFVYTVGATVEVPDFDDNMWSECAPGIHFFIDRRAAVEY